MDTLRPDHASKEDSASVPFAKLIPLNDDAKRALDELMEYPRLSPFHRGFIEAERIARTEEFYSRATQHLDQALETKAQAHQPNFGPGIMLWTLKEHPR